MVKSILLVSIFLMGIEFSFAQITNSNTTPTETKKKEKKKKEKKSTEQDSLIISNSDKSTFYLTGAFIHSFRKFEDNSAYQSLGERYKETPINTYGIGFGTYVPLANHFELDIGVSYVLQGEQYTFTSSDSLSDSSFTYVNKYRHFGVPLRLKYNVGNGNFKGYITGGLIPSSILSIRYESKFTNPEGVETINDVKKITNDIAFFNLTASIGIGMSYTMGDFGFLVAPEYRYNLLNTFESVPITHKLWSWGVNFGVLLKI